MKIRRLAASRARVLVSATCLASLTFQASVSYGSPAADANPSNTITIVAGTYGRNCGQQEGNATLDLARRCDGQTACTYLLTGDVAGGGVQSCRSDLIAQWQCGDGQTHAASLAAGAAPGDQLLLGCREFPGAGK
jgi:hypothetical protein